MRFLSRWTSLLVGTPLPPNFFIHFRTVLAVMLCVAAASTIEVPALIEAKISERTSGLVGRDIGIGHECHV